MLKEPSLRPIYLSPIETESKASMVVRIVDRKKQISNSEDGTILIVRETKKAKDDRDFSRNLQCIVSSIDRCTKT